MKKLRFLSVLVLGTCCFDGLAEDVSPAFDWTPGEAPTGWFTSWGGEAAGARHWVVGADGAVTNACMVWYGDGSNAQKWTPWQNFQSRDSFTLATYGCTDLVTADAGKMAVLWSMGPKAQWKIALVKDDAGHVKLVQLDGSKLVAQADAGRLSGYHLITVRFSAASGASVQVDDGGVVANDAFRKAGEGLQFGSVFQGLDESVFQRGVGFVLQKVVGYDTAEVPAEQYAALVASYPKATKFDRSVVFDRKGEKLYLPSLENTPGNGFLVKAGALVVPAGATATLDALAFADDASGLELGGALKVGAGREGRVRVASGATLVLVATRELAASGYVAAGVTVEEGGTVRFEDEAGNVLPSTGTTLAGSGVEVAAFPCLRISEIMPKPVDKPVSAQHPATLERMDANGLESGWVELENTSASAWADLADYKFLRVNRSKATSKGDYGNFPSVLVAPGAKFVFYTSERYSNSADMSVSAWAEADAGGARPKLYGDDLHNVLVWPDKVNPKKSPFVRLVYTGAGKEEILDTVVIPSDVPEGHSVVVEPVEAGRATVRWLTAVPTRGRANTKEGLVAIGPNAGPLHEIKSQKKHASANEFARPAAPARPGEDYPVVFSMNPTMHPTQVAAVRDEDRIAAISIVYRAFGGAEATNAVDLATDRYDAKDWGHTYQAAIPADALPAAGGLVQWKFVVTDASGNTWTTPSFRNKDDGYEWYGTIVEPTADQASASLPTWHMFAEGESLVQMDVDKDDQDLSKVPNYARVAIYDQSTSNYYDYVRIDLRGHTSAHFSKKSHGLRFAKAHPLTMADVVRGGKVKDVRKSSLIGEPADPSYMRQMVAFWLWAKMGNPTPFDFPVRCNLNGAFYQLAFHSERFTDELIEDFYGLDKFGYGYKNVGTLKSGSGTTAGGIEKKTPDDGNEGDVTVLQNELRAKVAAAQKVSGDPAGADGTGLDNAELTRFVVRKFNLPAWINYLASARITQETDDVWANISAYYDNAEMKAGVRGTDTWMPLCYDFNLSFGQYYAGDIGGSKLGLMATNDWFKSHPFYGGNRVRCYRDAGFKATLNSGNDGVEAVWQSAKFRRLYLRRLRTLMDQELKAPGTPEAEVPFMAKMRELAALMQADVARDKERWPHGSANVGAIDVWGSKWPPTMDAGIDEIWSDYVVPRRRHLYETHAAGAPGRAVGYASQLSAGIPGAQSAIAELKAGLSAEAAEGGVVIRNANAEAVDLSGWTLEGPVRMTLPAGTVVDAGAAAAPGEVFVVTDRRAYVAARAGTLTDEVIVGNAAAGAAGAFVRLVAADGTPVQVEPTIAPGATAELAATDAAAAAEEVKAYLVALGEDDVAAGLSADSLMVVAEPATDAAGAVTGYRAAVAVNPAKVPAPLVGGDAAQALDPIAFEAAAADGRAVAVGVVNAVKGLWYGYAVADEPTGGFALDKASFRRATGASVKVSGSARTAAKGFFRVIVLPARPAE